MVPILLGRVNEDVPREEGKTPEAEREDAPVEEEAEVERGADELREMEREIAEVGLYKLEIQIVVEAILKL